MDELAQLEAEARELLQDPVRNITRLKEIKKTMDNMLNIERRLQEINDELDRRLSWENYKTREREAKQQQEDQQRRWQEEEPELRRMYGESWYLHRTSQTAPPVFDANEANRVIRDLSAEYDTLAKFPSQNTERMAAIIKDMDGLQGKVDQTARAARQASIAEEVGVLNRDVSVLSGQLNSLMNNPTQHHAEIGRLQGELDKRMDRLSYLENGGTDIQLNWRAK